MSIRPKQFGRLGTFYLQESVLDVLAEHYNEGYGIGPSEISRRAGIYRERGPDDKMNDAIVTGILNTLQEQNKVERTPQENQRGGWRLTSEEYERRRDDL